MLVDLNLNMMWSNTQLTKILNMNYTKFSQTTRIRLIYKLYIDVKLKKEVSSQGSCVSKLAKTPKCAKIPGWNPNKPATPTPSRSPARSAKFSPRPRRMSDVASLPICLDKDYESDLDSDIDSESFDSDHVTPEFTMEQYETEFHYV